MNENRNKSEVITGKISSHLLRMMIPSIGGMFAITIFNITDTFFVSRLGTEPLAAMGFTFPVVMTAGAVASGISLGTGSVLARALGQRNHHKMNRIATDGILLAALLVILFSFAGIIFMDEIFTFLGAEGNILFLVREYMTVWFLGAAVFVMPPVSDASMRALGDMHRPFQVMLTCAVFNLILDPVFIFGMFGVPPMGIKGAAVATFISRLLGMILSLSYVYRHYGLIDFKYTSRFEIFDSWKEILHVGIPGALIRLLPQLVRGVITRMAAVTAGVSGVAAVAAGSRIESFATIISMAVGTAVTPLVGQNWGAKKYERVKLTMNIINIIAVVFGLSIFVISIPFGKSLGSIFTTDKVVLGYVERYIRILFIGSIGLNLYNWTSEGLNAAGKPFWAMLINIAGTILIILPLTFYGSEIGGFTGMLAGLCAGQMVTGAAAVYIGKKQLSKE